MEQAPGVKGPMVEATSEVSDKAPAPQRAEWLQQNNHSYHTHSQTSNRLYIETHILETKSRASPTVWIKLGGEWPKDWMYTGRRWDGKCVGQAVSWQFLLANKCSISSPKLNNRSLC